MTEQERAQARADELEMLLIREAVSIAVMGVLLIALSPQVQLWIRHQWWRVASLRRAAAGREEAAVAQLRRELSRDLPQVERGEVTP